LKVITVESIMQTALRILRLGDVGMAVGGRGEMLEEVLETVFVVDSDGRYLGTLSRIEPGTSFADIGRDAMKQRVQVRREDSLWNVVEIVAWSPFVVGVTDEQGRLMGALTRESIFATLRDLRERV
jgi:hypothetical protein